MGFSLDIKELEDYRKDLSIFGKIEFDNFLKKFLLEQANRILAKTKKKTPVDTGALINAWELGPIEGSGTDIFVEIKNPMEYATYVEYGHRIVGHGSSVGIELGWVDGRFMLKKSIDEIQAQLPSRYEKAFNAFCKERGLV